MSSIDSYCQALNEVGIGFSYPGQVEELEKQFLQRYLYLCRDPVVLDVGAHSGDFSKSVKSIAPTATIYAFEPHPLSYQSLEANLSTTGIRTFNFAIGERDQAACLYDVAGKTTPFASVHKAVIEDLHKQTSRKFDVQMRSIDSLLLELNIERVDLLKVDTEGHELAVFHGCRDSIKQNKIKAIQFEFNDMNIISRTFFKDYFDYLSDFRLYRLSKNGMINIEQYVPMLCEVFALQTIVGIHRAYI